MQISSANRPKRWRAVTQALCSACTLPQCLRMHKLSSVQHQQPCLLCRPGHVPWNTRRPVPTGPPSLWIVKPEAHTKTHSSFKKKNTKKIMSSEWAKHCQYISFCLWAFWWFPAVLFHCKSKLQQSGLSQSFAKHNPKNPNLQKYDTKSLAQALCLAPENTHRSLVLPSPHSWHYSSTERK